MTDPAQIARSLSKAQRLLALASEPDDVTGKEGRGAYIAGSLYRTAKALKNMGIGDYTHGSPFDDMYWNNRTGLAVRAELEEMEGRRRKRLRRKFRCDHHSCRIIMCCGLTLYVSAVLRNE